MAAPQWPQSQQWHRGMIGVPIPAAVQEPLARAKSFLEEQGHDEFELFSGIYVYQPSPPYWQLTFQKPNPDRVGGVISTVLFVADDGRVSMLGEPTDLDAD